MKSFQMVFFRNAYYVLFNVIQTNKEVVEIFLSDFNQLQTFPT